MWARGWVNWGVCKRRRAVQRISTSPSCLAAIFLRHFSTSSADPPQLLVARICVSCLTCDSVLASVPLPHSIFSSHSPLFHFYFYILSLLIYIYELLVACFVLSLSVSVGDMVYIVDISFHPSSFASLN